MRQIRTRDLFILYLYHNNSNHLQNENNNPLSSLNKIYVFTSWPQNIFARKTTIGHPTQYHFFLHSDFKTSAQTTVRTKAACANINQAVVLKKAFWLLKKFTFFWKWNYLWKKYVTPGISNLSYLFILHFITYKCKCCLRILLKKRRIYHLIFIITETKNIYLYIY